MRFLKLSLATLLAVPLLVATLTSGCVENKSSVYIHQVQAYGEGCNPPLFAPGELTATMGVMDPGFENGYTAGLLIGNQLTPLGESETLRSETSRFIVKGYEVYLLTGDLSRELLAFTQVASGTVSPTNDEDPGFGGVFATLIPAGFAVEPNSLYVANVRVFGETLGGTPLETAEFSFAIQTTPYGVNSYGYDQAGDCVGGAPPEGVRVACLAGQDGPTSCALCKNGSANFRCTP